MKGAVINMGDYNGICAACFEPIGKDEKAFRFRPKGRKFHEACAKSAGNYYVRLEMRLAKREEKKKCL